MLENKLFYKKINMREYAALISLQQLGLSHITLPFECMETEIVMPCADPISHRELSLSQIYRDCLKDLYSRKNDSFSPGIYAFYGSQEIPLGNDTYGTYLRRQIQDILNVVDKSQFEVIRTFAKFCRKSLSIGLERHYDSLNDLSKFSLLHGDLHTGNILIYHDQYKLIDFEFLRFGPRQLELSFLMSWDYLSGEQAFPPTADMIKTASCIAATFSLSKEEEQQIVDVFFPLIILLSIDGVNANRFANNTAFQKGLLSLYERLLQEGEL